jgi:hypothetical protein
VVAVLCVNTEEENQDVKNVVTVFCEHKRIKSACEECGGSSFYEHGRQESTCKECGGSFVYCKILHQYRF